VMPGCILCDPEGRMRPGPARQAYFYAASWRSLGLYAARSSASHHSVAKNRTNDIYALVMV